MRLRDSFPLTALVFAGADKVEMRFTLQSAFAAGRP